MIHVLTAAICVLVVCALFTSIKRQENFASDGFPIYIINLPQRNDRKIKMMGRIKNNKNYYVKNVSGVYGKNVIEGLQKGQIGCWLSHVNMWKQIAAGKEDFALVLEDDADISLPTQLDEFNVILGKLPKSWDICYLGGHILPEKDKVKVVDNIYTHNRGEKSRFIHSHAYFITKKGAQSLVNQANDFSGKVKQKEWENIIPVDDWMTSTPRNLNLYIIQPSIVWIDFNDNNSNINDN